MVSFNLSRKLKLPVEAMTETFAFLAAKGYGKTYTAHLFAEQMYKAKGQFIAIDPTGKWWCLRLAADGKTRWSDIPIFGGNFGDFPLPPDKGSFVAELVVEHGISAVFDVSTMLESEKARFVGDFAAKLKLLKAKEKEPTVLHLFLEEAQDFLPQHMGKGQEKMKGALTRIVRQGRNWGIGVTMISQRPQSISKEALNMASCLVVGCMVGTHERKAIKEWINEKGKTEATERHLDRIPKLQKGEMVVWSPSWLDYLDIVRFNKKQTFDASATPRLGSKKRKIASPKAIDAEAIRAAMEETEVRIKESDPRILKKQVRALEKQIRTGEARLEALEGEKDSWAELRDEAMVKLAEAREQAEVPNHTEEELKTMREVHEALSFSADKIRGLLDTAEKQLGSHKRKAPRKAKTKTHASGRTAMVKRDLSVYPSGRAAKITTGVTVTGESNGHLKLIGRMRPMLQHLHAALPGGYTKDQLAILVGMAAGAGGFNNYLRDLRKVGLMESRNGQIFCTDAGAFRLGDDTLEAPATTNELLEMWINAPKIVGKAKDILRFLVQQYPKAWPKDDIASHVGMASGAGGFNNYMRDLKKAKLIEKDDGGYKASDYLFP